METKFIILEEVVMVNVSEIEHTCAWMHEDKVIGTIINLKSGREVTTSESMEVVRDKILQVIRPIDRQLPEWIVDDSHLHPSIKTPVK